MVRLQSRDAYLKAMEAALGVRFQYDNKRRTWCVTGPYRNGGYVDGEESLDTDPQPAASLPDAEEDAIMMLETWGEPAARGAGQ